jgi:hypothetical protein
MAERLVQWPTPNRLKSHALGLELCRRRRGDETILPSTKPFSAFGAEFRKPAMVIKRPTNTGEQRRTGKSGEKSMRTLSFILAFVFVVAGSSIAGSVESGLPGVGTFSYNGTPVAPSQTLIVAVR